MAIQSALCAGEVTALRNVHLIIPVVWMVSSLRSLSWSNPLTCQGWPLRLCRGPCPAASHPLCYSDPAVSCNLEQCLQVSSAPPPTAATMAAASLLVAGAPEGSGPWEAGPKSLCYLSVSCSAAKLQCCLLAPDAAHSPPNTAGCCVLLPPPLLSGQAVGAVLRLIQSIVYVQNVITHNSYLLKSSAVI